MLHVAHKHEPSEEVHGEHDAVVAQVHTVSGTEERKHEIVQQAKEEVSKVQKTDTSVKNACLVGTVFNAETVAHIPLHEGQCGISHKNRNGHNHHVHVMPSGVRVLDGVMRVLGKLLLALGRFRPILHRDSRVVFGKV